MARRVLLSIHNLQGFKYFLNIPGHTRRGAGGGSGGSASCPEKSP
jgi:hypothetical protein